MWRSASIARDDRRAAPRAWKRGGELRRGTRPAATPVAAMISDICVFPLVVSIRSRLARRHCERTTCDADYPTERRRHGLYGHHDHDLAPRVQARRRLLRAGPRGRAAELRGGRRMEVVPERSAS